MFRWCDLVLGSCWSWRCCEYYSVKSRVFGVCRVDPFDRTKVTWPNTQTVNKVNIQTKSQINIIIQSSYWSDSYCRIYQFLSRRFFRIEIHSYSDGLLGNVLITGKQCKIDENLYVPIFAWSTESGPIFECENFVRAEKAKGK